MLGWQLNELIAGQEGVHPLGLGDSSDRIRERWPGARFLCPTSVLQAHSNLS